LYNSEFTSNFEQKQSILRGTVTTKGEVKGDNFIFIIEGLADAAVERGANGLIPVADDGQTSETCNLKEYHHLARKKNFNIYASSVDQRMSMQRRGVTSTNYRTDQLILAQLDGSAYDTSAVAANLAEWSSNIMEACTTLDENFVPRDGERYGLLTPKAWANTMAIKQFASSDWVPDRPFMKYTQWRWWNDVKWAMHPNLPGKGTAEAHCFVFHKGSTGHALNMGPMHSKVGQNDEQDYSWARTTSYQGSKLLIDEGVFILHHDDTAAQFPLDGHFGT
jgi:hypothetical protein